MSAMGDFFFGCLSISICIRAILWACEYINEISK